MPDISFNPLLDDDTLNAASLNTPFAAIEAGINGVMEYGTIRKALNRDHLASLVVSSGWTNQAAAATLHIDGEGTHFYPQKGAGFVAGTDGLTDRYLIGAGTAGTYPSADELQFNHAGVLLGMARADRVMGVLVFLNVEFASVDASADTTTGAVIAIQIKTDASVTWFTVDRTERYFSATSRCARRTVSPSPYYWPTGDTDYDVDCDMALRTLVTASDITAAGLDPATDSLTGVRAVVAIPATGGTVELGRTHFSILPLHAEQV